MSDEIVIDEDVFPIGDASPPAQDEPTEFVTLEARRSGPSWSTIALLCIACLWIGANLDGCKRDGGDRDDAIVIDDKGQYALILQDASEAGQAKLTPGQKSALNSTLTKDQAKELGFDLRILDTKDDVSSMEPIWQTLKSKAAPPPSLTATDDGNLITGNLPEGVDGVRAALESIK